MYNELNQQFWVTKQGEKLNPITDMTQEHIVNVMNMLCNRAKKNDARMNILKKTLTEEELSSMMKQLKDTDTVTTESLVDTPLFIALTEGLKMAIKMGRIEGKEKKKSQYLSFYPQFEDEVPYPIDSMYY